MDNPIYYSDLIAPDSSIENLIVQLGKLQDQYGKNLEQVRVEAQNLANSIRNVSGATEQGRQQMQQTAQATQQLAQSNKQLTDAEKANLVEIERAKMARREAMQMAKAEAKVMLEEEKLKKQKLKDMDIEKMSYNQLSAMYSQMKLKINSLTAEERKQVEMEDQLISRSKKVYEQMKKLQEETGKHQLNVGNYYEGVSNAMKDWANQIPGMIGGNNALFKSFMALGSGMQGTTTIMGGLSAGLKALGTTLMSLMANPVFLAVAGVAAVGTGIKWWYDYNTGIQEATRLTREFTGMVGQDLVNFRSEILAIADTWGKDFKETLQATDAVAANFKISFEEAATAIKDGFQAGADLNGDFLNKLQQYPAYFKEAGLSVRQFVAILTQTRSGIFGDQGLDAIKQANARIREMSKGTADALNAIKIDSEQVQQDLVSGAKTTFDVLQEVSAKLAELPPASKEVGEVLVNVFGKQGRDAGLEMIKALQDINTNLDEVKKGTGELGELEAEQAQAEKDLQVALASLFDATGGSFERLKSNISVFTKKALTELIKGFIKVANAIIEMYNKSKAFRAIWQTIGMVIKAQVSLVTNILIALKDLLVGLGRIIYGGFTGSLEEIKHGIEQFTLALPRMVASLARDTATNLKHAVDEVSSGQMKPITIPVEFDFGNGVNTVLGVAKKLVGIGSKGEDYEVGDTIKKALGLTKEMKNAGLLKSNNKSNSSGTTDNDIDENSSKKLTYTAPKSSSSKSSSKSSSSRTKSTGRGGRTTSSGNKPRQEDPIKALENELKKEWALYQENLKQYRAWQESQDVYIDGEEELQKTQAQRKYDRQIQDLRNTQAYYSSLHKINAANQWTPEQDQWINDRITALQLERTEALLNIERQFIIKRNELEKDGNEMVLKTLKEGSKEEFELRKKNLELERSTALMQDAMKPIAEQLGSKKINAMYDAELHKIEDEYTQHYLDLYDKEQEFKESEFDLLNKSEAQKTKFRLKAEKERLQKVLELNEKMNNKMSDVEVATIQNQIKKIDQEMAKTGYNDVYDMMGLSLNDEQKAAIDQSLQYATEALNTFMDAYVKAAEAKVALADKEVDSAKKVLENEIEARNQGYASDVATAQKELDLARKNQQKALEQQRKAQRAQALMDAATQASSLITATANIWSSFTKLGPWGVAAAIAATTLMWGSFAASKIKALQMTSGGDEQYGEGTVELLAGGSHQSGNDVDLGRKKDGTRRRAEGGEFFAVINKRNSRRYRKEIPPLIRSLNNGTFGQKYLNAYKTDDGLIFNINGSSEELKSISNDVREIRKRNERKVYVDGQGNIVEQYRNVKRTIRRN